MSFDDFLYQTCIISRPAADGTGRYNQTELTLTEVAENVACRMVVQRVRVLDEKTSEYAWVRATLLLFPAGTDVQTHDQISITGEDGDWLVKQHLDRRAGSSIHHVSVIVEALNG